MTTKNVKVVTWVTPKQLDELKVIIGRTGLSRAAVLQLMINLGISRFHKLGYLGLEVPEEEGVKNVS